MTSQCVAVTANGERCRIQNNLSATGLCLWHDPDRTVEAKVARRRGGKIRRKPGARTVPATDAPPAPRTLEDIVEWASWTAHAVATGRIDPKTGREISYSLTVLKGGLKDRDLVRQVGELEAQLAELKEKP